MSRRPAALKAAGLANRCCGVRYRGADAFGLVAVLSWQFRNVMGDRYEYLLGFQLPRQTQFYGVRWEFWN